jgi:hypothetical protein
MPKSPRHTKQDASRRAFNFKLNPSVPADAELIAAIDSMPRGVLITVIRKAVEIYRSSAPENKL